MARKNVGWLVALALLAAGSVARDALPPRSSGLLVTGIVTTNDVIISSRVGGAVGRLLVNESEAVTKDQLMAVIEPDELRADTAYYAHVADTMAAQVKAGEAALRFQERQTADNIRRAEAMLAAARAQQAEAAAHLENANFHLTRTETLSRTGLVAAQQLDEARTAHRAAAARVAALNVQGEFQRSAVALARAETEQIAVRRTQLDVNRSQSKAARAEQVKADVRLAYTEIRAPIDGIVNVRAIRSGEVVTAGQPLMTLINPDDLWVRVDVEETYVDRIRTGDQLSVRLPSGIELRGTVAFRGVNAGFATQRDVSRSKRDIKTFEIRVRVPNDDRRLAPGMTAYVFLPVTP